MGTQVPRTWIVGLMLKASVLSLKGGVGKTSVVLGLAGAAADAGMRTLVVDVDPAAYASLLLGADAADFTLNDVLHDGREGVLGDAVQKTPWHDHLFVVPSEMALENRNGEGEKIRPRLARTMQGVDDFDLVLFDTPPALGALTTATLIAADRAVVVTEPEVLGVVGAAKALEAVDVVRRSYNEALRPAGVIVNKVRPVREHTFRVEEITEVYPDLVWQPVVPYRSVTASSQGAFIPVQQWKSAAATEMAATYVTLLEQLLASAPRLGPTRKDNI